MTLVQIQPKPAPPSALSSHRAGPRLDALVDRTARKVDYLRVSLTDRCNYRCTYCMPAEGGVYGPRNDILSLEEVASLCRAFAAWGVRRVRLTGGEPTLRRGLLGLIEQLSAIPTSHGRLEVVMTTNGERLGPLAAPLVDAGLASITVSLDSLQPDRFTAITRRGSIEAVVGGIDAMASAGCRSIKLNTVAIEGFNDDELGSIARFAWDRGATPRFIELMPMSGGALFVPGQMMSAAAVRAAVARSLEAELVADDGVGVRGSGPASYWRVVGGTYDGQRLGTIGALTENFCAGCNRLRISASGRLHGCLARDDTGDLRAALRSGNHNAIEAVVAAVLGTKRDAHGFELDGTGGPSKAMVSIGG